MPRLPAIEPDNSFISKALPALNIDVSPQEHPRLKRTLGMHHTAPRKAVAKGGPGHHLDPCECSKRI